MTNIPYSTAAERNQQPILEQLSRLLPGRGTVLEIGSGTGQHAVFFSRSLTGLLWQPSDRSENLAGLRQRFGAEANDRILPVLKLDVVLDPWPGNCYEAAYSANTAHIMPWGAVVAMFTGISAHLVAGGRFCLYGPFNIDNQFTAPSNERFDAQLRSGDPHMGIRDIGDVESLAGSHGMQLEERIGMPANNFMLVFRKTG